MSVNMQNRKELLSLLVKRGVEQVINLTFDSRRSMVELQTDLGYSSNLNVDITLPANQKVKDGYLELLSLLKPVERANLAGSENEVYNFSEMLKTLKTLINDMPDYEVLGVQCDGEEIFPYFKVDVVPNKLCPYRAALKDIDVSDFEICLKGKFVYDGYGLFKHNVADIDPLVKVDSAFDILHESEADETANPLELNSKVVAFYEELANAMRYMNSNPTVDYEPSELFDIRRKVAESYTNKPKPAPTSKASINPHVD